MNPRDLIVEVIQEHPFVVSTGTNDPRVVEIVVRGNKGEKGDQGTPGIGAYLMDVGQSLPPSDTPSGTIIYRKG